MLVCLHFMSLIVPLQKESDADLKLFACKKFKCNPANICCLEDVFKTSSRHVLKTFSTHLQRNNFTSSKTS